MAQLDLKLFGEELILSDIQEAAIQELDILFGTEETELLGDYNYGMNFEQFLWKLQPSVGEVNQYIQSKITNNTLFCKRLNLSVETNVTAGTLRDIYVISISITDDAGETTKLKDWILK